MSDQSEHISLEQMLDMAQDLLTAAEQEALRCHSTSCAECAIQMARIERLFAVTRADDSEEVPDHVTARAVRLMHQRNAATQPQPTLRQLMAVLHFDSARTRLAPGMRSQALGARQVMFTTGQHDVIVQVKPIGERWLVWGQVFGLVDGGQVELLGTTKAQAELNNLSEFSLPPVPPGNYALTLRLINVDICMALDIGA